jgi:hypothetical protein
MLSFLIFELPTGRSTHKYRSETPLRYDTEGLSSLGRHINCSSGLIVAVFKPTKVFDIKNLQVGKVRRSCNSFRGWHKKRSQPTQTFSH